MAFIRKNIHFVGLFIALCIFGYFVYTHLLSHPENELECIENYTSNEIDKLNAEVKAYIREQKNGNFNHPILIFKQDSLIYWEGDVDVQMNKLNPDGQDTSYLYQTDHEMFQIDHRSFGSDFTAISKITILNKGRYFAGSGFGSSCVNDGKKLLVSEDGNSIYPYSVPLNNFVFWIYIILTIIVAIILSIKVDDKWFKKRKDKLLLTGIVFFFISLILFIPTTLSPLFRDHWLTRSMIEPGIFGPNLLMILLILTGFLFILFVSDKDISASIKPSEKSSFKFISGTISYLLLCIFGLGMIIFINWVINHAGIDLMLERLHQMGIKEAVLLIALLLTFSIFFRISQNIFTFIHRLELNIIQKLTGIIFGLLLLVVATLTGLIDLPLLPLSLSYLIFIIILDLYQDKRSLNSTWVFTWMILISAFLALVVFNADLEKDLEERKTKSHQILKNRDVEFERDFLSYHPVH